MGGKLEVKVFDEGRQKVALGATQAREVFLFDDSRPGMRIALAGAQPSAGLVSVPVLMLDTGQVEYIGPNMQVELAKSAQLLLQRMTLREEG